MSPAAFIHRVYVCRQEPSTLRLLRYLHSKKRQLQQMGARLQVVPLQAEQLGDPRLREALEKKDIGRLPAVDTGRRVLIGVNDIVRFYETAVNQYRQTQRPSRLSENLDEYYAREVSLGKGGSRDGDEPIGGDPSGSQMMDNYRKMMNRRESSNKQASAPHATGGLPAAPQSAPPPSDEMDEGGGDEDDDMLMAKLDL